MLNTNSPPLCTISEGIFHRTQDLISALKEEIAAEDAAHARLERESEDLDALLLEIKRLLYELCKLLDVRAILKS